MIYQKTDGDIKKLSNKTIQNVASELEAHERECAVYRDMTKMSLDKLESRIKRLELLIMASTASILGLMFAILTKAL
tara:strand:+ start:1520 stop:1750 length:231 start_codon:yes stop_codon:yes gene_type:complete